MRLFVTGGAGFIGAHFLRQAVAAGHEVVALRFPGTRPRIDVPAGVEWRDGDLGGLAAADLAGCGAVVHFAAYGVSPQKTDWATAFRVNVTAGVGLLEAAEQAGVGRILLCGSCMEYGRSGTRYERIPPDAPLEPTGAYAASKAAFSLAAASFARTSKAELVLLRPFHFYGEGQHPENLWPALRAAALGGADFEMSPGEQVRDFQPVENTAACFLAALARWPGRGGELHVANLGSGQPVTLREFASEWWRKWNARGSLRVGALPYREGEVMRFVPQIS